MSRYKLPFRKSRPSAQHSSSNSTTGRFINQFNDENHLHQERPCLQPEPETLSASVDLEDIIEDYDGASHKSRSASILSFLASRQLSSSYFSISGTKDDETSFYSALPDGFSLNDDPDDVYELANESNQYPSDQDSFWTRDPREGEKMLPRCDFQVNWYDVDYKIKPPISLRSLWTVLDRNVKSILISARDTATCGRTGSFEFEKDNDKKSTSDRESISILQKVSGSFKSGELTGVMGPSGAGKTSLLNFLSRRREDGFTGHLYLNNAHHRIKVNSIPQEDRLPEYLTVRENLSFASRLKNTQAGYDHEKTIDRVSNALGLTECLDVRTKNISGGQLKRLSIAQELLSRPDILILDEPTSGLDSATCFKTLLVLKKLVKLSPDAIDPIAVVLTIHQPQHEVFDLFDKVYVMAKDGIVIFDGPPNECLNYVKRYAGLSIPNSDYNPAAFMIEIASGEYGQEPINALANQVRIDFEEKREKTLSLSTQAISPMSKSLKSSNLGIGLNGTNNGKSSSPTSMIRSRNAPFIDHRIAKASSMNTGSFWLKTGVLTRRCWTSIIRDPKQLIARIVFHFATPLFIALLMGAEPGQSNACPHYKPEIHLKELTNSSLTSTTTQDELLYSLENVGLLFIIVYSLFSINVATTTLAFTLDIQNSLKEYHNGWYSMPSYILARMAANIIFDFCLPTVTVAVGYMATSQYTGNHPDKMSDVYRIILTALAVSLGSMIAQITAMIIGTIYIGHVVTALFVSQGAILPFSFLSGIVVRIRDMSTLVSALSMTSFFRHTLELTFLLRWGWNVCNCDPSKVTGSEVKILGVNDDLKNFVKNWMTSDSIQNEDVKDSNSSAISSNNEEEELDLFQTVAKQVSLFNTYGIDVKSCNDIKPYQLMEFQLDEDGLITRYLRLLCIWAVAIFLLMLTVKLVIHLRTSL